MTLGWLGNVLIITAMILIGRKQTCGWLYSIAGNVCWCVYAISLGMWDVLFIDGTALVLAGYYFVQWRRHATDNR
jgi:glucose dehydrogenase